MSSNYDLHIVMPNGTGMTLAVKINDHKLSREHIEADCELLAERLGGSYLYAERTDE